MKKRVLQPLDCVISRLGVEGSQSEATINWKHGEPILERTRTRAIGSTAPVVRIAVSIGHLDVGDLGPAFYVADARSATVRVAQFVRVELRVGCCFRLGAAPLRVETIKRRAVQEGVNNG